MILCLDAGNTRLKWGLRSGDAWRAHGALTHGEIGRLIELLPAHPQRIVACNVAGPGIAEGIGRLANALNVPLEWFKSSAAACGVVNGYDDPAQLGADRWAALIGARGLHAGPSLVVVTGTATTIDVLAADGRFRGGLILPGLELMRGSLARNTAGLPEARGVYREIPTNTDDAIASGTLHATLGAIERMTPSQRPAGVDQGRRGAEFCVILSGGAAAMLVPRLALPCHHIENLVLEGLAHAAITSS